MPPKKFMLLITLLFFTGMVYVLLVVSQLSSIRDSVNRQFQELRIIQEGSIPTYSHGSGKEYFENITNGFSNVKMPETKYTSESRLGWLDRASADGFQLPGDGSCAPNSDRARYQELLQKWHDIAERLEIRFFLDYGALLGAWRDENIIPWDHDLDIRIHIDDFEKLLPLREKRPSFNPNDQEYHMYVTADWRIPHALRRQFNCRGQTVDHYTDQCSFTDPYARLIKGHTHLDIFVYTTYHDTVKYMPASGPEFLIYDVFPIKKCKMMGLTTRCPKKPKVILDNLYDENLLPRDLCKNGMWERNAEFFKRQTFLEVRDQKHTHIKLKKKKN